MRLIDLTCVPMQGNFDSAALEILDKIAMLQKTEPSVSVIISTLNRAAILKKSLTSLRYQNYSNFEVVVVNGPSTDDTSRMLEELGDSVVLGHIGEANLSKSRNAGIALSKGELVLFLDDDAFAEPNWIANIVSGYNDPSVGAVGTRVYNYTGFNWERNPYTIDDCFEPNLERKPPVWAFEFPDAKTVPHILGASSSFRRSVLVEIGGFDEEIEYFLDESELCRRVIEAGYNVRLLERGACVHHKFSSGVTRDERREILLYPYPVVKNKLYCTLSRCREKGGRQSEYITHCNNWVKGLLDDAHRKLNLRRITRVEYDRFVKDVERAVGDGRERALRGSRKSVTLPPAEPDALRHYKVLKPDSGRKTICFISRWTPRRSPGGVARYIWDLATGFALRGHDVHLITTTDGQSVIEFEDGLWLHNLSDTDVAAVAASAPLAGEFGEFQSGAARTNVAWARAAHREVSRLRKDRYIDLVVAPAWDQEGLYCVLDRSLRTVVSMNTTFRKYSDIEQRNVDTDTLREVLALEKIYIRYASAFHANSDASAAHLKDAFGVGKDQPVVKVPHGVSDMQSASLSRAERHRLRGDAPLRVLYVSRLEARKGTDLFLEAAAELATHHPDVEIVVVGRDAYESTPQRSYRTRFEATHRDLKDQVKFYGEVSHFELERLYEQSDIFCVPSRFESFGIVFIEAMRYGIPVVVGNTGGAPEIVVDGETGIICKEHTSKAFALALSRLVIDRELRLRLGENGRKRYLELFENEIVIDRTLSVFIEMMDGSRTFG